MFQGCNIQKKGCPATLPDNPFLVEIPNNPYLLMNFLPFWMQTPL